MSAETWHLCPATTNAVERKNLECKANRPLSLKVAMTNVYRLDKAVCLKHIASLHGTSTTYRSRTAEARANDAARRKRERSRLSHADPDAQHGPPDRKCSFKPSVKEITNTLKGKDSTVCKKRANAKAISHSSAKRHCSRAVFSNPDMEILGKNIEMEFEDENGSTWYRGLVTQYAAFFPSDNTTVYFKADDEDYHIV